MANLTQLLHFLKKDTGLVAATIEVQCRISEMINEIYSILVSTVQEEILEDLYASILEYTELPIIVKFDSHYSFFSGRKSFLVCIPPKITPSLDSPKFNKQSSKNKSPSTIINILQNLLSKMIRFNVHPRIRQRIFQQLFYYLGAELMNRVISNKQYCSRSKSLQIRMNLSSIEEWLSESIHDIPSDNETLHRYLQPVIQLTLLLQAVTSLRSLSVFLETMRSFTSLSTLQVHSAMFNYKYEVGEESFPMEVEKHVQLVVDNLEIESRKNDGAQSIDENDDDDNEERNRMETTMILAFKTPSVGIEDVMWDGSRSIPVICKELLDILNPRTSSELS